MMMANNMDVADALAKQHPAPVKVVVANARVLKFLWYDDYKPTVFFERTLSFYCAACGGMLADELSEPENYCPHCGQKLWWRNDSSK